MLEICLKILLWRLVVGEWIDMPQFSDENKIYRIPSVKQDQFNKFTQNNGVQYFPYEHQSYANNEMLPDQTSTNGSFERINVFQSTDSIKHRVVKVTENFEEDVATTTEEYHRPTDSSRIEEESINDKYYNESLNAKHDEILEYLPVDILRKVHSTLISQPVSTEGKILFLKSFEKKLMSEIESRLAVTMAVSREKRGAHEHWDHGYEEHDEHSVGFPSIEGALMAISFLTFAVYLVRLVMMLFRNMNNVPPTTTAATVYLGRRKRSVNQFADDMARILSNMDGFNFDL